MNLFVKKRPHVARIGNSKKRQLTTIITVTFLTRTKRTNTTTIKSKIQYLLIFLNVLLLLFIKL